MNSAIISFSSLACNQSPTYNLIVLCLGIGIPVIALIIGGIVCYKTHAKLQKQFILFSGKSVRGSAGFERRPVG